MKQTILVTGGAGFVGSNLCLSLNDKFNVMALDNLKRRGSELNVKRLQESGIEFIHGDVRYLSDLKTNKKIDWLIECSAEPSVHAGNDGSLDYLLDTNLKGALNCLEVVRAHNAKMIFLSSSRIYPIQSLRNLPLKPKDSQLAIEKNEKGIGWSENGITEGFPLEGARSLYGTTKLSAELFIQEYAASYNVDYVINRCGVIAGPWQMGKVDQGFVALWLARHLWGSELSYFGFGGEGLQVRDVLHIYDLADLIQLQISQFDKVKNQTFNIGGGVENVVSLSTLTEKAKDLTKNECQIHRVPETKDVDIPYYVTDNSKITKTLGWQPTRNIDTVIKDTHQWLSDYEDSVRSIFGL